jgi:hypothetical protein
MADQAVNTDSAAELIETIKRRWMEPPPADGTETAVATLSLAAILRWAQDVQRYFGLVQRDVDMAQAHPLSQEGVNELEAALWRLGAARKSLLAVCFLGLGARTLEPAHIHVGGKVIKDKIKRSVQFELHAELLDAKLTELGKVHQAASELNRLLVDLAEHAAITLRDEITHSLAPIGEPPALCLFELWFVDGGKRWRVDTVNFLWPRRIGEKKGITREDLWAETVDAIQDARALVIRAVTKLNELFAAVPLARQPPRVYSDVQTGRATIEDPPPIAPPTPS